MDFDFAAIASHPLPMFDIKSLASDPCTDVLIGRLERFEEKAARWSGTPSRASRKWSRCHASGGRESGD